jgi:antitoxin YefM
MTKTLPISQAREELTSLVDKAKRKLDEFVITVNGTPAAVLMSAAEFDSWKETLEIMSDPQLMKAIEEGEKEIDEGKGIGWDIAKKQIGL